MTSRGRGTAAAVVRGAARTLALLQRDRRLADERLCLPAGTTDARLVTLVVGYLSERPDELHLPDVPLVVAALEAAFPWPVGRSAPRIADRTGLTGLAVVPGVV